MDHHPSGCVLSLVKLNKDGSDGMRQTLKFGESITLGR